MHWSNLKFAIRAGTEQESEESDLRSFRLRSPARFGIRSGGLPGKWPRENLEFEVTVLEKYDIGAHLASESKSIPHS